MAHPPPQRTRTLARPIAASNMPVGPTDAARYVNHHTHGKIRNAVVQNIRRVADHDAPSFGCNEVKRIHSDPQAADGAQAGQGSHSCFVGTECCRRYENTDFLRCQPRLRDAVVAL